MHQQVRDVSVSQMLCGRAVRSYLTSLYPLISQIHAGAGKTNVAMLTVVAHLRDKGIIENEDDPYAAYAHIGNDGQGGTATVGQAGRKIVYIAPSEFGLQLV